MHVLCAEDTVSENLKCAVAIYNDMVQCTVLDTHVDPVHDRKVMILYKKEA